MTGDFNAAEDSPPYDALLDPAGMPPLTDSYRAAGLPEGKARTFTFHGFDGQWNGRKGRIDWLLHSPHFTTTEAGTDRGRIDGRYPSDHFPVWATLRYAD